MVFLLALFAVPGARGQTYSVVHAFAGGADGAYPHAGVTLQAGKLYGTTRWGGTGSFQGQGTAYEIARSGSSWMLTPIFLFGSDGANPLARTLFGPDSHLYGTNSAGVFDLIPQPVICRTLRCFWKKNSLYDLDGSGLGQPGYGDLFWDTQGNIWGTAQYGGPHNDGGIYSVTCAGSNCSGAPVYIFSGPDGANPEGGALVDSNGNVFTTTFRGGQYGYGTIVELTYQQGVGWSKTYQYDFQQGSDGGAPIGSLISDGSGNLIGTTSNGGNGRGGTVFELSPSGNSWTFSVLYTLPPLCSPYAALSRDSVGNLYGTCSGATTGGNVFKLTKSGNAWTYTSLHDFTGPDGWAPYSTVTIGTDGTLYGTTTSGGSCNGDPTGCGTVWMIKP